MRGASCGVLPEGEGSGVMGGVFMSETEKAKLATLRTLAEVYLKIGAIKDVQRALDDMRDVLEGRGD